MKGRMIKALKVSGIAAIIFVILVVFYLLSGFAKEDTQIDYIVEVDNITKLARVTMTIQPNKVLFLDLSILEPRSQGKLRVENFEAKAGEKSLPHWRALPNYSAIERIWIGFSNEPITINYTIDTHVTHDDRGKALSFLADEYGYFRGMYILYTPITFNEGRDYLLKRNITASKPGIGAVEFILPDEWEINDPWSLYNGDISIADFRNTYWALGKSIEIIKYNHISIGIVEKMSKEEAAITASNIERMYEEIVNMTGIHPKASSSFWALNILPPEPIYGGAAGENSLLTNNDINTIAHEMFHWWNGLTVDSNQEANWIKEGFTTYYEGKILYKAGIWTEDEFKHHINNLEAMLNKYKITEPIDLIEASNQIRNADGMEVYYKVYNGGALLAYYLDKELEKENKSLDEIWLPLYNLDRVINTKDFLDALEAITDVSFRSQVNEMIQGKIHIPYDI